MIQYGILGSTGVVGKEVYRLLCKHKKPSNIRLFASRDYCRELINPNTNNFVNISKFNIDELNDIDILFSCVNKEFSNKYTTEILNKYPNIKIIDNSSAFRYNDNVPLVIPEINGNVINKNDRLIANPNCTTAISALALHPINELFNITKIIMSTYQAASGAGQAGMNELMIETNNYMVYGMCNHSVFQHPLPFNIIPHIDNFQTNKYTNEEMKVVTETKKIFNNDNIDISCTAVRIPIKRSHSMSITVETKNKIDYNLLNDYYKQLDHVISIDDNISNNVYPMPINSSHENRISVGRIRPSLIFKDNGCDLFVCGDQLLRGAALNSVLISVLLNNLNG
jgi:aspartate-semialdehyde dehydrogenase